MKILRLVILGSLSLFTYSCRLPCNGFPADDLKWIPYKVGETLKYSDNTDTIVLKIEDYFKSERSDERNILPVMDVDCNEHAYYETDNDKKTGFKIKETVYSHPYSFEIEFQPGIKLSFYSNSKYTIDENVIPVYYAEKEINGTIFKDLFIVDVALDNKHGSISRFVLVSDYGIIEFIDSKNEKTWRLIKN